LLNLLPNVDEDNIFYDAVLTFAVTAVNINDAESSVVYCNENPLQIMKVTWLQGYSIPWAKAHLTSRYHIRLIAGTTTYTVPSGKCAVIYGYHLSVTTASSAYLAINDFQLETATSGNPVDRTPQETNGMYLEYGDHVDLVLVGGIGIAQVWIHEFDANSDVSVVVVEIGPGTTYQVTSGKTLIITWIWAYESNNFQIYEDTSGDGIGDTWISIFDAFVMGWNTGEGVLQIPQSKLIQMETANTLLFGVEIKGT
jgi:hypothetical protein